jgi:hypothetical protein
LFWLKRNASVVSVEHDPSWFHRIKKEITNGSTIDYRLVLPEPDSERSPNHQDPSDPDNYLSTEYELRKHKYLLYAKQIDEFPDRYFDVVFIDGRARPSCIKHSVEKVKAGGMLIVDDSERNYYFAKTNILLQPFSLNKFSGAKPVQTGLSSTDIYVRLQ